MKMRHKAMKSKDESPKSKKMKPRPNDDAMDAGMEDKFMATGKDMPPVMGGPPKRRLDRKRGGRVGC